MANDLTDSFPEYWSRRMQRRHEILDVYRAFANFEEQKLLVDGDIVHRPYRSALTVNDLGSEGSFTRQDITDTSETLTVNVIPEVSFWIRDPDKIQSHYRTANEYADDAAVQIGNKIDGDVLGEYDQADSKIGLYEMTAAGSASDGVGFTLTVSNILKVFGLINRKLDAANIAQNDRWCVLSPEARDILWQFISGKESQLGDRTGKNGHLGEYAGLKLYMSNACGWSGRLELGSIPTENDTITVNGVTWRWKATATQAGDIDIGASVAISCDNLVAAINNSESLAAGIAGTLYWEVTAANRALLRNIVATDGSTYVTFKAEGRSYVIVSETLSAGADIWTTTKQIQHILAGQGKPIDVVIQKFANLLIQSRSGYVGKDFVTWTLYGLKTFAEGAAQLVDVQIVSEAY